MSDNEASSSFCSTYETDDTDPTQFDSEAESEDADGAVTGDSDSDSDGSGGQDTPSEAGQLASESHADGDANEATTTTARKPAHGMQRFGSSGSGSALDQLAAVATQTLSGASTPGAHVTMAGPPV